VGGVPPAGRAVFGAGTVALSDRWDFIACLRYYHFSEDKQQFFGGIFGEGPNGEVVSQPGNTNADGLAPRFILSYKIADTTKINAQVSRGFRLGGINDPLNFSLCTPQDRITFGGHTNWSDETIWDYELGAKSRLLDGKASVDVSVFYMDINDLQTTVTAGSCSAALAPSCWRSSISFGSTTSSSSAPTTRKRCRPCSASAVTLSPRAAFTLPHHTLSAVPAGSGEFVGLPTAPARD